PDSPRNARQPYGRPRQYGGLAKTVRGGQASVRRAARQDGKLKLSGQDFPTALPLSWHVRLIIKSTCFPHRQPEEPKGSNGGRTRARLAARYTGAENVDGSAVRPDCAPEKQAPRQNTEPTTIGSVRNVSSCKTPKDGGADDDVSWILGQGG